MDNQNFDILYRTDAVLWDRFRSGDEHAFSLIFNRFIQVLYSYGSKFQKDEVLLKDGIQELFIKLYNNCGSLGPTDSIRLYLFKALKHKLLDQLSASERMVSLSSKELEFTLENLVESSREEDAISEEQQQLLSSALKQLTPRQQEVIYLRYTMEMSVDEISTLLAMNVQSVRNLLHRSLDKLRSVLIPELFFLLFTLSD